MCRNPGQGYCPTVANRSPIDGNNRAETRPEDVESSSKDRQEHGGEGQPEGQDADASGQIRFQES